MHNKKLIKKGESGWIAQIAPKLMNSKAFASENQLMNLDLSLLGLNPGKLSSTLGKSPLTDITKNAGSKLAKANPASGLIPKKGFDLAKAGNIAGMGLDIATNLLPETEGGAGHLDKVATAASFIPVVGQGLNLAIKGFDFVNKAFGKKVKGFSQGDTGTSAYQNFSAGLEGDKKFKMTDRKSRRSYQDRIGQAQNFATQAKSVVSQQNQAKLASANSIGNVGQNIQNSLQGIDYSKVFLSKKGSKLQKKDEVLSLENGGCLIPSGALHARKHNLKDVNPELKDQITDKGIPVISYAEKGDVLEFEEDGKTAKVLAEGGEIVQHAEIESGEVIFTISLTKQLEALRKKGTPEAAIEAGKILATALMENTIDNVNLIENVLGNEDKD